ncbi:MAG: hypothetical protein ABIF82_11930 [Planctomycetota bacterium]
MSFWFKPQVIRSLTAIKNYIEKVRPLGLRRFFQVAFSETVRESSNTRNGEFKLYRYRKDKLADFDPDVFGIMTSKLKRNLHGLEDFVSPLQHLPALPHTHIYSFNTVDGIPARALGYSGQSPFSA